jgi:hypothetical protein
LLSIVSVFVSLYIRLGIAFSSNWYYHLVVTTISLKLPKPLLEELEAEAGRRGVSKSALIRESVEKALRNKRVKKQPSCLDLVGDLVGKFRGSTDLSSNPDYLEQAIVADYRRDRKHHR